MQKVTIGNVCFIKDSENNKLLFLKRNRIPMQDLYTGVEYQQTQDSVHALKMITRTGSEKIVRYAFEFAKKHERKKVTCFTKDNILKLSDGLFHKVYDEISTEYPDIESEHWIIDIGSAKMECLR